MEVITGGPLRDLMTMDDKLFKQIHSVLFCFVFLKIGSHYVVLVDLELTM